MFSTLSPGVLKAEAALSSPAEMALNGDRNPADREADTPADKPADVKSPELGGIDRPGVLRILSRSSLTFDCVIFSAASINRSTSSCPIS
jgi:hypothetical protein